MSDKLTNERFYRASNRCFYCGTGPEAHVGVDLACPVKMPFDWNVRATAGEAADALSQVEPGDGNG
ncbi:MAG TPA: hypothetical protein VMS08_00950 [Candidatus Saccharimonadia bacterium]|nr:hypothetical protein [Candidatus Saccharimonadia bacterium]